MAKNMHKISSRQNVTLEKNNVMLKFRLNFEHLIKFCHLDFFRGMQYKSWFTCWISIAPAFQSWFGVENSPCFISVMNLDLYVHCFDSLMSRCSSRGPNSFYVYMNHI